MTTALRASTPPPPSSIHTPSTPKYGWEDNYQPYSPRKSARISSQRLRAAQTPPPQSSSQSSRLYSPRSTKKECLTSMSCSSSPSSPQTPSNKMSPRSAYMNSARRISGALNDDSTASAAAALGLRAPRDQTKNDGHRSNPIVRTSDMLPTPAKTPKKQQSETSAGIKSIARSLFPVRTEAVEEVMPSPKKGRKRYTGLAMDSFSTDEVETAPIQIYTDSHDRVPEFDLSADNPFYGEAGTIQPELTKRKSKRRKITIPGETEQTVEEAEQREDGLVYVFRGKKIFRKFAEDEGTGSMARDTDDFDAEVEAELDKTVPSRLHGPLTRSSIKPRLLFPTPKLAKPKTMRSQVTEDEEEAMTDIEEPNKELSTPTGQIDEAVSTPNAPRFAPASPPTTVRATRSGKKVESDDESPESPMKKGRGRGRKVSPFDRWQRTKNGAAGQSKKRDGDPLTRTSGDKRLRGSTT